MLAEHVQEHLSADDNRAALALCNEYLKPGGIFRIAVPDGHRRDPDYVAEVTPPRDGHQMLFTVESLTAMVEESGFRVRPLEYFDASGMFHAETWEGADGHIMRSARYDRQIAFKRDDLYYTSLILDAIKP
jgi:predicted SAM-dependent methyltransferase